MILSFNPKLLDFGCYKVEVYGLFAVLATVTYIFFTTTSQARKRLMPAEDHLANMVEMTLAVVLSARLFFVIENYNLFFSSPLQMFSIWSGGMSFLGGVLGAIGYVLIKTSIMNIGFLNYADILATYAPLTHSIARIGCFLAGCCFGKNIDPKYFHVVYNHNNFSAPCNQALIPIQLYYSGVIFLIFLILFAISRLEKIETGILFFTYLFLEGFARAGIEFFRDDCEKVNTVFTDQLSNHQIIALLVAAIGLFGIIYKARSSKN